MKTDLKNITDLCMKNPIGKKILIVPTLNMAGQILKVLNDEGLSTVNLAIKTVDMLAYGIVENEIIKQGSYILNVNNETDMVRDVIFSLKSEGKLCYFNGISNTYGFNRIMASTIREMKMGGLVQKVFALDKVEVANKKKDIETILSAYENALKKNNCLDRADVINMAIDRISTVEKVPMLAISDCRFSYTEKMLLEGMECEIPSVNKAELLHYEKASKHLSHVEFKKVYGDVGEVKEVLRTIWERHIPFDKVAIIALENEPYTQLLYQDFCTYIYKNKDIGYMEEMPVTFGSGLPLVMTSPAKFLLSLLNWISDGYTAHDFINIFAGGTIDIIKDQKETAADAQFGRMNIINVIKNSDLKWQRDTYIPMLENYRKHWKEKCDKETDTNAATLKQLHTVEWLLKFVKEKAFENIPPVDADGKIDVDKLVFGLKNIVNEYVKMISPLDIQGLQSINTELNTVIKGRKIPIGEIVSIITTHISDIRIMPESPSAGKIHFSTYRGAEWIGREYVFLIGMDVNRFPCNAKQNPILLDSERDETLKKSYEYIDDNICAMSKLLKTLKDDTVISYSYYNTSDDRENYPSTVYNSIVENVAQNMGIPEYDFWRKNIKTVNLALRSREDYIDETDCILSESVHGFEYESMQPNPVEDYTVDASEYPEIIDPRMRRMPISASALSVYFDCPYRYYLQYVLGLKQIDDEALDKLGWLSHFEIGHLYHEIFEKFETRVMEDKHILTDVDRACKVIKKIAEELLAEYETALPVASEYQTNKQKEEIFENVKRFAENEVANRNMSSPIALEFGFGKHNDCYVELPGGKKFLATGFVDRIDMKNDHTVKIIDYKTGSTFGYEVLDNHDGMLNAKSVQPVMYYLALKAIAKNSNDPEMKIFENISSAEYYFVTAKGNYEKFTIEFDKTSEMSYKRQFNALFDTILNGDFSVQDANCKYCPYRKACKISEEQK